MHGRVLHPFPSRYSRIGRHLVTTPSSNICPVTSSGSSLKPSASSSLEILHRSSENSESFNLPMVSVFMLVQWLLSCCTVISGGRLHGTVINEVSSSHPTSWKPVVILCFNHWSSLSTPASSIILKISGPCTFAIIGLNSAGTCSSQIILSPSISSAICRYLSTRLPLCSSITLASFPISYSGACQKSGGADSNFFGSRSGCGSAIATLTCSSGVRPFAIPPASNVSGCSSSGTCHSCPSSEQNCFGSAAI